MTSDPNQSHDILEKLRRLGEPSSEPGERPEPAADDPAPRVVAEELRALAEAHGLQGERDAEAKAREAHLAGNEEWARTADTPVMRRELASLFQLVGTVSADSKTVGKQLGTLLGVVRPIRFVGWILLALMALDLLMLFAELEWMNPESEYKTISGLTERSAVPLMAVVMVFWGGIFLRGVWAIRALKGLSWLCLAAGVGYFAAIPLAINDASRLYAGYQDRTGESQEKLQAQIAEFTQALERADTPQKLAALVGRLTGKAVKPPEPEKMDEIRGEVVKHLARLEQEKRQAVLRKVIRDSKTFWVQAVKLCLAALLSGIAFVALWWMTGWVRELDAAQAINDEANKI